MVAGWPRPSAGPGRPTVRLVDADELQCRGGLGQAARRRRLGRGRDDVARPDGVEQRRPVGQAARRRWRCPQGISARRSPRMELCAGARRVLARVTGLGDRGERRRQVRERDRPGRGRGRRRRRAVRGRRAPRRTQPRSSPRSSPFLPDGVVTAGNSGQIVDGAAAVLVTSEAAAGRFDLEPRAASSLWALRSRPVPDAPRQPRGCEALQKAGLGWDDISVIEVNGRSPRSCSIRARQGSKTASPT